MKKNIIKSCALFAIANIFAWSLNANVDYVIYIQNPAQADINQGIQPVDQATYHYIQEHYLVKYQFPMSTAEANKPFIDQLSEPERRQLCEDERMFIEAKLKQDQEIVRRGLADKIHLLPIPTTLYELFFLSKTTRDEFEHLAGQMQASIGPDYLYQDPHSFGGPIKISNAHKIQCLTAYFRNFIRVDKTPALLDIEDNFLKFIDVMQQCFPNDLVYPACMDIPICCNKDMAKKIIGTRRPNFKQCIFDRDLELNEAPCYYFSFNLKRNFISYIACLCNKLHPEVLRRAGDRFIRPHAKIDEYDFILDQIRRDPGLKEELFVPAMKIMLAEMFLNNPNSINNAKHEIYSKYVEQIEFPINLDTFIRELQATLNTKLVDYIKHVCPQAFTTQMLAPQNVEVWIDDNITASSFFYEQTRDGSGITSLWFGQKMPQLSNILKQAAQIESNSQNTFALWRGTDGITVEDGYDNRFYIDKLHKGNISSSSQLHYLSYGNSIFSGSILDKSASPAYHFWNKKIAYGLKLNKHNYLFNPESFERKCFFVTPLSTMAELFGILEHFHSQTFIFPDTNPAVDQRIETEFQRFISENKISLIK